MFFDASLLGESLDDLAARLDAHGTTMARWTEIAPALARAGSVAELVDLLRPDGAATARRPEQLNRWDELLVGLLRVAADDGGADQDAVLVTIHLVAPGADRLVRRGFDTGLVLGQLAVQILTYPWQTRTRAVAANLLLDTEHALCLEARPAYMRTLGRVRTGSAAVPINEIVTDLPHTARAAAAQLFSAVDEHDDLDLVDLLLWAERTGVVDARDLSMLVEYHYAREFTGAGHEHVARVFGVTARTSKRRCTAALTALQQAATQYLAA
jgi:hypothetical protein